MMIDLHCHILPGIDDGARDWSEAVAMCRLAAADGCEALIATPHQRHPGWWNGDRVHLLALVSELQRQLGPHPRVLPGAEVRIDGELLAELDHYPAGSVLPLAGSRYLLIEFERLGPSVDPQLLVHELSVAGWSPIIAHPEHYPWLFEAAGLLERLAARGALFQITAASLLGQAGKRPQLACGELLDRGLVHFLASDAHGIERRPPGLARAREEVARGWGRELADTLVVDNPAAVLAGRPLREFAGVR